VAFAAAGFIDIFAAMHGDVLVWVVDDELDGFVFGSLKVIQDASGALLDNRPDQARSGS
jgi:hypothetical protein